MPTDIMVFEDREDENQWRVGYFDRDGGCYVAIFAGPGPRGEPADALRAGVLRLVILGPALD